VQIYGGVPSLPFSLQSSRILAQDKGCLAHSLKCQSMLISQQPLLRFHSPLPLNPEQRSKRRSLPLCQTVPEILSYHIRGCSATTTRAPKRASGSDNWSWAATTLHPCQDLQGGHLAKKPATAIAACTSVPTRVAVSLTRFAAQVSDEAVLVHLCRAPAAGDGPSRVGTFPEALEATSRLEAGFLFTDSLPGDRWFCDNNTAGCLTRLVACRRSCLTAPVPSPSQLG